MKEKLRAEDRGEMKFQERWPEEMHKREEERDEEHIEAWKSQKDEDQSLKKQRSRKKKWGKKKNMGGIERAERQIFTLHLAWVCCVMNSDFSAVWFPPAAVILKIWSSVFL